MESYKVDFRSTAWETPAVGVRFKVHKQGRKQLRLVEFTSEFIESDWCAKGHIGYILAGQLEVDFNGELVIFNSGDGLFIPAGEEHKHKARVITDVVRLILVEYV
jgi:quercetin dioxygenase-like cupin family protein